MLSTWKLLFIVCSILVAGLVAIAFLNGPIDLVAQSSTALAAGEMDKDKDKDHSKTPKPCGEGGCMTQTADGTQTASNGHTCTSGVVCTNPGQQCSLGGKRCRNYEIGGSGGNCTCACM